MVCARCIRTVSRLLAESGITPKSVDLGEVEVLNMPDTDQINILRQQLSAEGFELLDDRNSRLVEQIKNLIINEIHHQAGKKPDTMNFSTFLARETRHEYSQISKLFSGVEGITIEKFIILQKTERVKELLVYNELSLGEIAFQTGYSSTQHLSNQFRQVTGLTPTQFKSEHRRVRKAIDTIF